MQLISGVIKDLKAVSVGSDLLHLAATTERIWVHVATAIALLIPWEIFSCFHVKMLLRFKITNLSLWCFRVLTFDSHGTSRFMAQPIRVVKLKRL